MVQNPLKINTSLLKSFLELHCIIHFHQCMVYQIVKMDGQVFHFYGSLTEVKVSQDQNTDAPLQVMGYL